MFKASNILGMQVINLFEGQVEGYVKNLVFSKDYKKLKFLIICSDKSEEKQYLLSTKNIYKILDVIFIKNSSCLDIDLNQEDNSPINLSSYQADGKNLGKLIDVSFDEKFNVEAFITTNSEVKNSIAKINKQLIIFNSQNNVLKIYNFKPSYQEAAATAPVSSTTKTIIMTNPINYNFLLGRKVTRDILTFNNEVLIRSGTTVNEKTVQIAKQNGKLRELALNI